MKSRFTTIDLRVAIAELGSRLMGLRVINIYDTNNKTYLIKLQGTDQKEMLYIESGTRFHSTEFDWPKSNMPSNFSMKLRKHLKGRRLTQLSQLGLDRVIDLQFGSEEAAYHLIVELYDRGNVILTDYEYTILNLLRTRKDGEDIRFAVRETYPLETAKKSEVLPEPNRLREMFVTAKQGDSVRKILNPHFVFGPAVIEHCLIGQGFQPNVKYDKDFNLDEAIPRMMVALTEAESVMDQSGVLGCKGYVIQKREKKPAAVEGSQDTELLTYVEYHPFLYRQHEDKPYVVLESFNKAVDEFYSKLEGQKMDMKVLQQERDALKKLANVRKDHEKRLNQLADAQDVDKSKAELIEMNLPLIDKAIKVVCSAIANQIDWTQIDNIILEAKARQDPVALAIKKLKLDVNHMTMILRDPYEDSDDDDDDGEGDGSHETKEKQKGKAHCVDIDLGLSAYANARSFHDHKKFSKKKEQRTVDASQKAMKSAEWKTKQALKDVATVASINKTRKTYWFEKFFWFISSENYLVIAGRDQQQNEMVVKKYLTSGDIYVHADLHGASSVIIKNHNETPVPPKTLNEAGVMAVCYSVAWDAKVVTSAWWVCHDQVSKTAPTGEYLTTGSFMIRGKKNYLQPAQLMMGFGFMFKLDESSVSRHKDERKVKGQEDDEMSVAESSMVDDSLQDEEISLQDEDESNEDSDDDDKEMEGRLEDCQENIKVTKGQEDSQQSASSSDEDNAYPDTAIQLHHVQGAKLEPERTRGSSVLSTGRHHSNDEETVIYLGDDQPILVGVNNRPTKQMNSKQYLSSKQKRLLKKQKKHQELDSKGMNEDDITNNKTEEVENSAEWKEDVELEEAEIEQDEELSEEEDKVVTASQQPPQVKRGQKNKLKKIKQKYKDQDDEERRIKMEILASAGNPKEPKGKKAKQARKQKLLEEKHQQLKRKFEKKNQPTLDQSSPHVGPAMTDVIEGKIADLTLVDQEDEGTVAPVVFKHTWKSKKQQVQNEEEKISDDDQEASLKDEQTQLMQDSLNIVDTLTGCPHIDDLLLFGLPVCAPYSVLHSYKFKVKLTPGNGKRGRAAKTALNMFQIAKDTTHREKDLFKSVKDVDLSRNLPGKVKVSAPNLQKARSKGKRK